LSCRIMLRNIQIVPTLSSVSIYPLTPLCLPQRDIITQNFFFFPIVQSKSPISSPRELVDNATM
jgi:hypothetical protein